MRQALRDARKAGHAYLVIDGTVIPMDRVAADRPFCSGKHHRHGMNLQVTSSRDGEIVWVSGPLPGAVYDLIAARIWGIIAELAASEPVDERFTLRRCPAARRGGAETGCGS